MHSLIHIDYAKATARRGGPARAVSRAHEQPHAPPGRVRSSIARILAGAATRIDREAARRVVA